MRTKNKTVSFSYTKNPSNPDGPMDVSRTQKTVINKKNIFGRAVTKTKTLKEINYNNPKTARIEKSKVKKVSQGGKIKKIIVKGK